MKKLLLSSLIMMCIAHTSAVNAAIELYNQGFESDASGWFDFGGSIAQVSSGGGTLGVTSSSGGGHAEIAIGPNTGNGAFTRFGAYRYTWPGGFIRQSLDIYIDPAAGNIGDGWFLDNAVNDNLNNNSGISSDPSDWREAGGVGALKTDASTWSIAADADGGGFPVGVSSPLEITVAGWYTIVSEWIANIDGLTVDRNTFIFDSGGTQLYSNLNPQQVPLGGAFPIGGNRYGWVAANAPTDLVLAIDNSILTINGATGAIPEPTTLLVWAGLGFCCTNWMKRRSR